MDIRRRLRAAAVVLLVLVSTLVGLSSPAVAASVTLHGAKWSSQEVDATTGTATNTLDFTISGYTDYGNAQIALIDGAGNPFPNKVWVSYGKDYSPGPRTAAFVSMVDGRATYRYTFPIPKYAHAESAVWKVTQVQDAVAPDSPEYGFTARSLVDSTAPTLLSATAIRDVLLTPTTTGHKLPFKVKAGENQSGVRNIKVTATGPDGSTQLATGLVEGSMPVTPRVDPDGTVLVPLPVGSVGTWRVTEVQITDIVGNTATYSDLSLAPIVVTDNSKIQLTEITVPSVDTWWQDQTTNLTAKVSTASPITKAVPMVDAPCVAGTPVLPTENGGTLTIPIAVPVNTAKCEIRGLTVHDEAGNVSIYGSYHRAPALPTFTRMTGPGPELKGISIDRTTINWREQTTVNVTLDVHSWSPGVTKATVSLHTFRKTVDVPRVRDGKVVVPVDIFWDKGYYGASIYPSVTLEDAAGLTTHPQIPDPKPTIGVAFPTEVNRYTTVDPRRVLDTRTGSAIGAGQSRLIEITGLPADATTAVLNMVATEGTAPSFLTVWADGAPRPTASNLNFVAGQTVANLVTVPVSNGRARVYNHAGSAHVVADLFGYYHRGNGLLYSPGQPTRMLDTRTMGGPLGPRQQRAVDVGHAWGTLTYGVVLNVTVTEPSEASFLTVWADGHPQPATSNINFPAGWTGSNQVIVPVDPNGLGDIRIYNHAGNAHVIVDVAGYFDGGEYTSLFVQTGPKRVLDTRESSALGQAGKRTLAIPGLPANATAVVLNMTATEPTASSFLTVWPFGQNRPGTSNLNFGPGQTVPNQVTVPVVDGKVEIYNHLGSTHVVADLFGYYLR